MKRASAFVLIFSFLFLLLASGCNQSVDDMLDGYNGGFSPVYTVLEQDEKEEEIPLSPGDDGFDPEKMLREVYSIQADSTLILAGPPNNVYSYDWMVYGPISVSLDDNITNGEDNIVNVRPFKGTLNDQTFVIYVPQSGLEVNNTYKVTLRIVTQGGVFYKDSCSVVIYPHAKYN